MTTPTAPLGGHPHGAIQAVLLEREQQDAKWGVQNHHPLEWLSILGEEVGKVCQAANKANSRTEDWANYREEMVHIAAVAVAAIECLDRKGYSTEGTTTMNTVANSNNESQSEEGQQQVLVSLCRICGEKLNTGLEIRDGMHRGAGCYHALQEHISQLQKSLAEALEALRPFAQFDWPQEGYTRYAIKHTAIEEAKRVWEKYGSIATGEVKE